MGHLNIATRSAGILAALVYGAAVAAAAAPPDLTGVWTTAGPSSGGTSAPAAGPLPLTPYARARVDAYNKLTNGTDDSPGRWCVGTGMPGSMLGSGGYPMEILQRPEQINITYEAHNEVRRIYLGDRVIDPEEVFPERNGYSIGRWEDDTLIVETTRLVEQIDQTYAHSDQATIVERYTLSTEEDGRNVLTAVMTMTDPVFLTEPFTTEKKWQQVPNGRLQTYECTEPDWLDILDELIREDEARLSDAASE